MFLGLNVFLALLSAHFNPRFARAKMSLSRAKNTFTPANINSIVILKTIPMEESEKFHTYPIHDRRKWGKLNTESTDFLI